jgi:rRNA N6-adenosine-methyltransferase METTL5
VQISRSAVYSLHKRSTRRYIQRHAIQNCGARSAEVVAELRYDLPPTYKHHRFALSSVKIFMYFQKL